MLAVFFIAGLVSGCDSTVGGADEAPANAANYYSGDIVAVKRPLQFRLDCCSTLLSLGDVVAVDASKETASAIEAMLRGSAWGCTALNRGISDEPRVEDEVRCNSPSGESLERMLIDAGLVVERCPAGVEC